MWRVNVSRPADDRPALDRTLRRGVKIAVYCLYRDEKAWRAKSAIVGDVQGAAPTGEIAAIDVGRSHDGRRARPSKL